METIDHHLKILDFELGAGIDTGFWVPSLGWMDHGAGVGECDLCLGRRMGWLFDDQKD